MCRCADADSVWTQVEGRDWTCGCLWVHACGRGRLGVGVSVWVWVWAWACIIVQGRRQWGLHGRASASLCEQLPKSQ